MLNIFGIAGHMESLLYSQLFFIEKIKKLLETVQNILQFIYNPCHTRTQNTQNQAAGYSFLSPNL